MTTSLTRVTGPTFALAHFDRARLALEQASTIDEVREIHDQAEALRIYARQSRQSREMQNRCAEITLRAERRAGDLLAAQPKHPGGRPAKAETGTAGGTCFDDRPRTYADLGFTKQTAHRWQAVAAVPEAAFERFIQAAHAGEADGAEISTTALLARRTVAALTSSESNEYYTPTPYIEAMRKVLGDVLDPASNLQAQQTIRARVFYTIEDDGLAHDWPGAVWLNPPYGGLQAIFTAYLLDQYARGITTAAILLLRATATETAWFQPLWDHTLCFTDHRIPFDSPAGVQHGNTSGSVFVYLGPEPARFHAEFAQFGPVVRRWVL